MGPASYSVVTYATHSEFMFDELSSRISSLVVGGWGAKWHGFMDKIAFVREYAAKQEDDHIIIFVDGFDTRVVKDPALAVERFKTEFSTYRVLVSYGTLESENFRVFRRRIFGVKRGPVANSGLYMGYAKDLYRLMRSIESVGVSDDQRALNILLQTRKMSGLCIDVQKRIFHNLSYEERKASGSPASDAVFLGYNASITMTPASCKKILKYAQSFWPELASLAVGTAIGILAVFFLDRSYRCNYATTAFGIAFPIAMVPLLADSSDVWYTNAIILLISTMLAFHVTHLIKVCTEKKRAEGGQRHPGGRSVS